MYQLTNVDVFDKFSDQSNLYSYNPDFSQEDKLAMAGEVFD
jgi:hypothetical protein